MLSRHEDARYGQPMAGRIDLLWAWARVHSSRVAAWEMAVAGLLAVVWHDSVIEQFGPILLPGPVSALLVIPALSATAAVTAAVPDHDLPLPDPPAARISRVAWGAVWLAAAVAVSLLGTLIAHDGLALALIRNTAVFYAVACVLARTSGGQLIWAGPFVYMMTAMLFGASHTAIDTGPDAFYWWAAILSEHTTGNQLAVAAALAAVSLATRATTPGTGCR